LVAKVIDPSDRVRAGLARREPASPGWSRSVLRGVDAVKDVLFYGPGIVRVNANLGRVRTTQPVFQRFSSFEEILF
jgi:hypothetical protein